MRIHINIVFGLAGLAIVACAPPEAPEPAGTAATADTSKSAVLEVNESNLWYGDQGIEIVFRSGDNLAFTEDDPKIDPRMTRFARGMDQALRRVTSSCGRLSRVVIFVSRAVPRRTCSASLATSIRRSMSVRST